MEGESYLTQLTALLQHAQQQSTQARQENVQASQGLIEAIQALTQAVLALTTVMDHERV